MLLSISYILLLGMFLGWLCKKAHLPALLGMIATGILLGPYALNLIDSSILGISSQLRKIALIIILTRAGLTLNLADLKKNGHSAVLMCFLPACFEIAGMLILAPHILGMSLLDSAILGAVIAAVSPAVIVPKMIKLIEDGYGTNKGIPQMILAGASVDDVFVIVMFSVFTGMAKGEAVSAFDFIKIPFSIAIGIAVGLLCGAALAFFFSKVHIRDTAKVLILLSVFFILVTLEDSFPSIPFSSLLAVMFTGISLQWTDMRLHAVTLGMHPDSQDSANALRRPLAARLSAKFNKLWVGAEIILFVLVGATVDIGYAISGGPRAVLLILCVLLFRMLGVFFCTLKTTLNLKERLFCMMAYLPKATVQAAIGGIPLSMGLECGATVLTVAVVAIIITAPLGAFLIDVTYKKLLSKQNSDAVF